MDWSTEVGALRIRAGPRRRSAAAITYESSTPDQSVGPDFADHTVTATVTGLLPNVTYNVRAVATNSAGTSLGANQTLATPADPPPPPPVLGKSANVKPVSGIVYIELPAGAKLASFSPFSPFSPFSLAASVPAPLTKGLEFVPLTEARQIPVGSTLDTTGGVVSITTATTSSMKGKVQTGDFGAGIFKLLQGRKQSGLTELDIIDSHSPHQVCASIGKRAQTASKHLSSKVLGRLNSSDHGKFTTRGQYSAATVRGTVYSVTNQCDGTLTEVSSGLVWSATSRAARPSPCTPDNTTSPARPAAELSDGIHIHRGLVRASARRPPPPWAPPCVGGHGRAGRVGPGGDVHGGDAEDLTGICEIPASGTCSLRQLITYENNLIETPNPPDTIDVPAPEGLAFYDLFNGPLTIFKSVSIAGAGARGVDIDQFSDAANRVFLVEPNPRNKTVPIVTISGLSMAFGHANANNGYFGGDILNEATLTLSEDASQTVPPNPAREAASQTTAAH